MNKKNIFKTQYVENPRKVNVLEFLIYFIIAIIILRLIIFNVFYISAQVIGDSMNPTLNSGDNNDLVVVSRFGSFEHGDIVVIDGNKLAKDTGSTSKDLIKRVVGMAGDKLSWKLIGSEWQIFINGEQLIPDYQVNPLRQADVNSPTGKYKPIELNGKHYDYHPFNYILKAQKDHFIDTDDDGLLDTLVVPNNYVYVLGDNRSNSFDSKSFGVIKSECVQGKVVKVYSGGISQVEFFFKTLFL